MSNPLIPPPDAWAHTLQSFQDFAWRRLARGVVDRRAAARHPSLATVNAQGYPSVRTVVLRGVSIPQRELLVYTHRHSAKALHLAQQPIASMHVWDASTKLQIRLCLLATLMPFEDAAETRAAWERVPEQSRSAYAAEAPGQPIVRPEDFDPTPDPHAFLLLKFRALHMELLHLGSPHRRAEFGEEYGPEVDWHGRWLVP